MSDDSERDPLLGNVPEPRARSSYQTERLPDHIVQDDDNHTSEQAPVELKSYKRRFYVALLFSFVGFSQGWNWNTWGPIATSAKVAYGWSNGMVALLPAWGPIMYIITVLPYSWFIEAKGLRVATLVGVMFLVVGAGLRCITESSPLVTWMANIGQICVSVTGPLVAIASSSISATWFPPSQRTTATGAMMGIMSLGGGMAYIIGPLLVTDADTNKTIFANESMRADVIRHDIRRLMYIELGWTAFIFLLVLLYFPAKPPTPPSLSTARRQVNFKEGLKAIMKKGNFWFLSIPYALTFGVMSGWNATIDINLEPLHIDQLEAGLIGVFGCVAGLFASIFFSRIVDFLKGRTKELLIILFILATVGTLIFALSCAKMLIPFNRASLYSGRILSSACFSAMLPLVLETLCETCYPVPESVTNAVLTNQKDFWILAFLFILWIPEIGTTWMNWTVVGAAVTCIPVVFFYKESHRRLDVDYSVENTRPVNEPLEDDS